MDAIANRGKRIQMNASPIEYKGMDDTAPDSNIIDQKTRQALTQKYLRQEPSRNMIERTKNVSANTVSHKSAGLLSINKISGPKNQKI